MKNCARLCCYVLVLLLAMTAVSCSRDPNVVKVKYLQNGNRYFEKGKYKEAYIMYRNALKKDPRYSEAYYRVGLAELRMQRWQDAARDFRRAIDTNAATVEPRVELAELYLLSYLRPGTPGREREALAPLIEQLSKELLKLDPKSARGLRLKGYLELTSNRLPEAVASFRQANDLTPYKPEVVLPLAQSLYASGQAAEAEKLSKEMIAKDKTVGAIYDLLYLQAMRNSRAEEGEQILKQKIANNPKVADYMLQLANHYYALKRQPEMKSILDRLASKEFPGGYRKAGVFYRAIRDYDNAIREFRAGAGAEPDQKNNYLKSVAEVLSVQRKDAEALKILEDVLQDSPRDDQAQAMHAALLVQGGNPAQVQTAVKDLQAVVTRSPGNAVVRFNLGRALIAKGDLDQARVQLQEAARLKMDYIAPRLGLATLDTHRGDFGKALQSADEVLKLDPDNLPARLVRSSALAAVGNRDQARKELDETIKRFPNSREAHVQVGLLNLADKQYKEAESVFSKLYEGDSQDLRGLMGLSETYAGQGQYEKAVQLLQSELAKRPDMPQIQIALGNLAFRAEKYDLAIQNYQAMLRRNPDDGGVYVRLGETYRKKGDTKAAVNAFRKAKELLPNDIQPHLQLALLLDGTGQHEQALPIYQQILKLQPDNPVALNNLAYLMAEAGGDLDQALALAERAKQKLPADINVADTLGWIYIKKNLSDNAVTIFRDLVTRKPDVSTFRYHLGMALYQRGDKAQARKELQTALQLKPAPAEAAKIKELMGKLG
jgi:tetratricopeptide (TPR) repeat protein